MRAEGSDQAGEVALAAVLGRHAAILPRQIKALKGTGSRNRNNIF